MDRTIVYPGALPQTTDLLNTNKFGMVGQAYQNRAILGISTVVAGFPCTPTSPTPDLHVTIGVGSIYQMDPTDASAYGDIGIDNNNIMKQGILAQPAILTITPPGTAGFSQVFLVQAILNDVDGGSLVLSYYNSANPASPYAGPANSGTSQYTTRTCAAVVALKAGSPAATGSQTTPTPDVGYVGLYAITVANGQTQVTSGNIVQIATAPFFPTLPQVPSGVQTGQWIYAADTGTANSIIVSPLPPPAAYVAGMGLRIKIAAANTGATTINVAGPSGALGVVAVKRSGGAALQSGDLSPGQLVEMFYDGANFQLASFSATSSSITNNFNTLNVPYAADSGTVNAIAASYASITNVSQIVAGLFIAVKLANTITGGCSINVNAYGAKTVITGDLANPPNGVFVAGEVLLLAYDGTYFQIVNSNSATYRKPNTNTTIYVNTGTGNDGYDGTASTYTFGTSGPVKTIQKAVNIAFGYAPSQFTITIQVANGTYAESVVTPAYAGPNIVVNGASVAGVLVNAGAASCFTVQGPNTMTVTNLTVQNDNVYPHQGFVATAGGTMFTGSTASNGCNIVFQAYQNAIIEIGNHTFNGSSGDGLYVSNFNSLLLLNGTHTFSGPVSVGISAIASQNGSINVGPGFGYVNSSYASGTKWVANINGIIAFFNGNDGSSGARAFFPGNIAGYTQTGGQYSG